MTVKITKRIRAVIEKDSKLFISTTKEDFPFVAKRGGGDFAYDIEGNRFIDFATFISVYNLGINGNQRIRAAAKRQIDTLMHGAFTDYYSELPIEFAESLLRFMPKGFGRVFLSNSGTEANEAAIKFSRLFTKRQYLMAFYSAFHGRSMGSLSLTASKSIQREHLGPFPNAIHVPFAYCYRCPFKQVYPDCGLACVDYIKRYPLSKEVSGSEVAAIFAEPVQGEGGYVVPPPDFFKEIRKLADDNGILLVSDEVQAGYMRTGKFLAMDNFGVTADIYTMAKSIASGLPLGVTVARSSLGNIPPGSHATTFGGNLVSVAAAAEGLSYLRKNMEKLSEGILDKGKLIMRKLERMKEEYEIIGDVRGLGLMIGVEIVKSKSTKEYGIAERDAIIQEAFYNGLLLLPAGASSFRVIPPLTVSTSTLEKGMEILEGAVRKVNGQRR